VLLFDVSLLFDGPWLFDVPLRLRRWRTMLFGLLSVVARPSRLWRCLTLLLWWRCLTLLLWWRCETLLRRRLTPLRRLLTLLRRRLALLRRRLALLRRLMLLRRGTWMRLSHRDGGEPEHATHRQRPQERCCCHVATLCTPHASDGEGPIAELARPEITS